ARRLRRPNTQRHAHRPGLHAAGAPPPWLCKCHHRRAQPIVAGRWAALVFPLHRPRQPDLKRHLPSHRLSAGRGCGHVRVRGRLTSRKGAACSWSPSAQATLEQLIAEGDLVAFRFDLQGTHQGTHQGAFAGTAPTGKSVRLTGTDVVRIADGKLIELWSSQDTLNWALQLGCVTWVVDIVANNVGRDHGE